MIAVAGLEIVLCHSNLDMQPFGLFPAVASGCAVVGGLRLEDFSVVVFDDCSHTVHATIANLADVSVEKFVKQVIFREVLID